MWGRSKAVGLRYAGKFRERKLDGRKRGIMDDDFSLEAGSRWPGIIRLSRRQLLAATLCHAAAFRCMPGGATLPCRVQARLRGQNSHGDDQKRDRDNESLASHPREEPSPMGRIPSHSKQVVYPCWHLPGNLTWADSTPNSGRPYRQRQGTTPELSQTKSQTLLGSPPN